ncbi:MAG: dienelactone hydrolase family protein [Acutalibacteraceae bacterium]
MKKRIISFAMSVILIFCSAFLCAAVNNDVSINDGLTALRAQFSRDAGPKKDGFSIDYSFFSPVKSSSDTTKYPLVIIMAGAREGTYQGKELLANEFAYWSGKEYQQRFISSGGAFILIARAPEERLLCWDSEKLTAPLKAAIDDFTQKHPNVDTNRIYVMGWCLGAKGAINLAVKYENFAAAVVIMVPPFTVSEEEAKALSNTPTWLIGCKNDSYALYGLYIKPSWERICKYAARPEKNYFTTFDTAADTTYFFNHNVWLQVSHDMQLESDSYSGMKTINGNSELISTENGFIHLLSQNGVPKYFYSLINEENDKCPCMCHNKNVFIRLFWKVKTIINIFLRNKNEQYCACGALHWKVRTEY